jgi:predicted nucleotidyltransferase
MIAGSRRQGCHDTAVFTVEDRERVHERVLGLARQDPRVVAGAVLGSRAPGDGDRWSDLDLMFAVADGATVAELLTDWTAVLSAQLDAVRLFDLPFRTTVYRVFLLPGCLQLDLSFTPIRDFAPTGPNFRLLFGVAGPPAQPDPPAQAADLFGLAVHHALRGRFCIERARHWQAEYWISAVRDYALSLACRRRGLPEHHGRGFDELPSELLDRFEAALVRSLGRDELLRALSAAIDTLLAESAGAHELAGRVEPRLRELIA